MTVQWIEDTGSRQASIKRLGKKDKSTVDVKYKCLGALSDTEVHEIANQFFSANRFYSVLGKTLLVDGYEIQHLGGDAWDVTAHYESLGMESDEDEPLKRSRQFDTTGGTAHYSQAYSERRYPSDSPDQKKAIHVDSDSVKGVDVIVPALQWSETYDIPAAAVTDRYIKSVAQVTGTTNAARFRGFAAGEVLFVGCSGSQQWDQEKGDGPWSLTYKFSASPNAGTDQTWGPLEIGDITGVEKRGHEYLWVRYEQAEQGGSIILKPQHVYVNAVYRESNFNLLGIGS